MSAPRRFFPVTVFQLFAAPKRGCIVSPAMKWILTAAIGIIWLPAASNAARRPPLHDPVALNIGINCQWERGCMSRQRGAMKKALAYVARTNPPQWRVQLCNRNAGKSGTRLDWVGFDHCIRNQALRPPRVSPRKH